MMHIQAVDYVYLEAAVPEVPREREESKGLGPEVIGRKIVNPGIDKKNMRGVFSHACIVVERFV